MIKFKRVSKIYGPDAVALKDVSFHIQPKEFVSIVGPSGSGKSTIVKILLSAIEPDNGRILVGGWDISNLKGRDVPLLRRQIGVVFQDFKLLPQKTLYENVAFALEVSGSSIRRIRETVPQLLKIVGLEEKMHRYPTMISGGEAQRVALARALVHRPKLIVADEPTGNLDALNTREIINLLKKINEFGATVVLVTHDREVVNSLKRRVIALDNGRVVSDQERGKYVL